MQICYTTGRKKKKGGGSEIQGLKRQNMKLPCGSGPGAGGHWLCSCGAGTLSQLPGAVWKVGPWLQTLQLESWPPPGSQPQHNADLVR